MIFIVIISPLGATSIELKNYPHFEAVRSVLAVSPNTKFKAVGFEVREYHPRA
jgi:hypothetical protein